MRSILCFLILIIATPKAIAQSIYGPSPVGVNSTYTYSTANALAISISHEPRGSRELNPSHNTGDGVTSIEDTPSGGSPATWTVSKGTIVGSYVSDGVYYVTIKWTSTGTGSIRFTVNGSTTTKYITINSCSAIPQPGITNNSRCGPGSVMLGAQSTGYEIRWYEPNSSSILTTGSTFYTPPASYTKSYYASAYNTTNGCESAKREVIATIIPVPTVTPNTASLSSCSGNAIAITLTNNLASTTNTWTVSTANVTGSSAGSRVSTATAPYTTTLDQILSLTTINSNGSAIYDITPSKNGCTGAKQTVTITVTPVPSATATPQGIFSGNTTNIQISNPTNQPGTTFSWQRMTSTVTGATSGSGSVISQTLFLTSASPTGSVLYLITPSLNGCAGPTFSTSVTVHEKVKIIGNNRIALGQPLSLSTTESYSSYAWRNALNQIVGRNAQFSATQPGMYTVTVKKEGVRDSCTSVLYQVKSQFEGINENMIITRKLLTGTTDSAKVKTLSVDSLNETVQYFDGLGRPYQAIQTQASPAKNDIVSFVIYDEFGRETKQYLPYAAHQNQGNLVADPVREALAFYQGATDGIAIDSRPFIETIHEASPILRPLMAYGFGQDWKNANRAQIITTKINSESNKVIAWTLNAFGLPIRNLNNNAAITNGFYRKGQLVITVKTDEDNRVIKEYKTKDGKVILKEVQAVNSPQETNLLHWARSYYIYDKSGQQLFILQPELCKKLAADDTYNPSADDLDKFSFQSRFDDQGRLIEKKVPGCGWIYMILDARDRIVLTQDANQRTTGEWTFTKYDLLNRPVSTGAYINSKGRLSMQQEVDNFYSGGAPLFETYISSKPGNVMGYDNRSFPIVFEGSAYHTTNYYDAYDNYVTPPGYEYDHTLLAGLPAAKNSYVKGQMTASLVKNLGTGSWLRTVNYYDDHYRTLQTIKDNQAGRMTVSNTYDFAGRPLATGRIYLKNGATNSIREQFTYDHAGRLLMTKHAVNGAPEIILSMNKYNEIGQLTEKNLHSENNGSTFRQYIDYSYNIRGWLTKINDSNIDAIAAGDGARDFFGIKFSYQDAATGFISSPAFNGNISAIQWSKGGDKSTITQSYSYSYDVMNRLSDASHYEKSGVSWISNGNAFQEALSYDLNGNIRSLLRRDASGVLIDNLTYTYTGNQLGYVDDIADAKRGFVNGNSSPDDYGYDANGNLNKDKNKGLINEGDIAYNFLNLPKEVRKEDIRMVYHYDANGNKLRCEVYNGPTLTKWSDYVGELVYENDDLKFINTSEGRYVPTGNQYQYHLKDHLGNVHLTFTSAPQSDAATATLEVARWATEQSSFLRMENAKRVYSSIFDHTNGTGDGYAQRLTGGENEKYGLARSISVMDGDTIKMKVFAKYVDPDQSNWQTAFTTLMNEIATKSPTRVFEGSAYNTSTSSFNKAGYLAQTNNPGAPKAYLNWLVFDRYYRFITGGYEALKPNCRENGQNVAHDSLSAEIAITQPGYVYIYLSNEESTPVDVYFDDLTVEHRQHSAIIQMDDYYPFGLTFNSHRRDDLPNYNQFNGKERQNELGLGWDDFGARMYMSDIGRWGVSDPAANLLEMSSPYAYSLNSPIVYFDNDGQLPILINGKVTRKSERGDASYWDPAIIETIKNSGIPNPGGGEPFYVDGDRVLSGWPAYGDGKPYTVEAKWLEWTSHVPESRHNAGYWQARRDWPKILDKLQKDPESGKITEKIQIYTHSRGAAFGSGYVEALLELISENKDQFADPSSVIDFVFHMGPHQSWALKAFSDFEFASHHQDDMLSGNKMRGLKGSFYSRQSASRWPVVGPHDTASFAKDLKSFIKAYQASDRNSKQLIDQFVREMRKYGIPVATFE